MVDRLVLASDVLRSGSFVTEQREVIVVGAGLAGLAAARQLGGRDVMVLEADQRIGGRVRSLRRGRHWLNLGAHIIAGPGSVTRELAAEFDLPIVTPPGDIVCVAMRGRVVRARRPEELPVGLPISLRARASLVRVGIRLWLGYRRTRRADTGRMLTSTDPAAFETLPVDARLDGISMRTYLGPMHPDVEALLRVSVNRSGGELDDTSAGYGIEGLFGAFAHRRANLVGGTERLVDALVTSIPPVRLGARVVSVTQREDRVAVEYESDGHREAVEAAACVLAVPAPIALAITAGLPEWKQAALLAIHYAPFVVGGIFTTESAPTPWANLYAVAVPDASFCMFFNAGNALADPSGGPSGGAVVVYAAAERARAMLRLPTREIERRFVDDLVALFPGARDLISEVTIARWEFGAPTPGPGRARLQTALAAPVGRIAFAGDYLQYAGLDSALRSGQRAGRIVENWLR